MPMVFRILAPIPEIGGERGDRIVVYGQTEGAYLVHQHHVTAVSFATAVPLILSDAVCPELPAYPSPRREWRRVRHETDAEVSSS